MIPTEQANKLVASLADDRVLNLFAQADARAILYEAKESPNNFPAFDSTLDESVTIGAYALLSAGCSFFEAGETGQGQKYLEQAASLLETVHRESSISSAESGFHCLISGMAYYAAGQYSRAFVALKSVEGRTSGGALIAAYLRRNRRAVMERLSGILLSDTPEVVESVDLENWIITVAIARAIAMGIEFTFTGEEHLLMDASSVLDDAGTLAANGHSPAYWWIVRLLKLMFTGFSQSSLWTVLPPHFGSADPDDLRKYILLQACSHPSVTELWMSQRAAIPLALDSTNWGGVINLRTSAGKTRVAELAILSVLLNDPDAQVVYLAPFRSLAFEVEQNMTALFEFMGFKVSHLYGGARASAADTELAQESSIIIATPEKIRAIYRAEPEFFSRTQLFIMDEGHLLGANERFVKNELFIDHVRKIAEKTEARILILSAVLPNAGELAQWITGSSSGVAKSNWKPSAERFGLLRWNGNRVRLEWRGKMPSFNPSFIEARAVKWGRRRNPFPHTKREAIAATALKLTAIGPVMIFAGKANSVPGLAKDVLIALGNDAINHSWPIHEWSVFEAACREELEDDSIEFRAARLGIICHSNRLPPQVRYAMEHLMRSCPPKIVIATSTLAQGVNIGISSVIVASPYVGTGQAMSKRDFWNICGRAGRAFVDREGKILFAIDDTRTDWEIKRDRNIAKQYLDVESTDPAESGLLFLVAMLKSIAIEAGIDFELLLELVASNDFSSLGANASDVEEALDLIDDELLSMEDDPLLQGEEESADWVDTVFRDSLAAIQAASGRHSVSLDEFMEFMKTRAKSVSEEISNPAERKSVVASGLPLRIARRMHTAIDIFSAIAHEYVESKSIERLADAIKQIEEWALANASDLFAGKSPEVFEHVRPLWLAGVSLKQITEVEENALDVCKETYGFQLAWIIHAASQQLLKAGYEQYANVMSELSLLVELGLPNVKAANIFLAGIRSRSAATELSTLDIRFGDKLSVVIKTLRDLEVVAELIEQVSDETATWLNLISFESTRFRQERITIPKFTLRSRPELTDRLYARATDDGAVYLTSLDGRTRLRIGEDHRESFLRVANDPRFAFEKDGSAWRLVVRDPRLGDETD
ncbi:MAG TPA: DEAD/DEAH box helicase [Oculatellaceae cyanobacterium]